MNPTKSNPSNRFNKALLTLGHFLGYGSLVLVLSACNRSESMLEDYLKRLSRVLSEPIPTPDTTTHLPAYPEISELAVPVEVDSLSLIDAWNLNHCELFPLIGERNSILGKVSEPELRLDYEWRLLNALPACIDDDRTPSDLASTLTDIQLNKQRNFEKIAWLTTFANPDFAHQFSLSERTLKAPEKLDSPLYGETITRLSIWLSDPAENPKDLFLATSKQTNQFSLGGSVLLSQRLAIESLNAANTMLENASQKRTLCPNGLILKELEYAKNVMVNRFIGIVQPWLVEVTDGRTNSFDVSGRLLEGFSGEDIPIDLVSDYFAQATAVNEDYLEAIRLHTQQWQALFEACGERATPR